MKYKKLKEQVGLFDYQERLERLKQKPTALDRLDEIVNWEAFRKILEQHLTYSSQESGGRPPYDCVMMFKVLVLQKYYGLSEEQTEAQILDRFSFQRFLDICVVDDVPDENTIWTFKQRLGEAGIEAIFKKFNEYLADAGLTGSRGKIVDASFVEVPRQRNSRDENEQIKQGECPDDWDEAKRSQKDLDARWTKKNNETHYGYKNHIKVNAKSKVIEDYEVTDASVHDSQALSDLIDEDKDGVLYGDSAYRSEAIEEELKNKEIKSRIHERAYRGRALTAGQQASNRKKSRIRARVEHVFGFQSVTMGADKIRSIGKKRARQSIGLGNLIYNMFRFGHYGWMMC